MREQARYVRSSLNSADCVFDVKDVVAIGGLKLLWVQDKPLCACSNSNFGCLHFCIRAKHLPVFAQIRKVMILLHAQKELSRPDTP